MSVFKTLTSQDIIVSPLELNKSFTFSGGDVLLSAGIMRYTGSNNQYDPIYNSIKQLYYSNYVSGSNGEVSNVATASLNSDGTYSGLVQSPLYDNYLDTNLNPQRYIPTGSGDIIRILSISKELYGDNIKPGSFELNIPSGSYKDDSEGRILTGSNYCGNIIYKHGIIILSNKASNNDITNFLSTSILVNFSSSLTIYETQYRCIINENDFNYTLNPSTLSDNDGKIYDHFTGSYFNPYISSVGLYNEERELLAIGKLAQPLPLSRTTDVNVILNLDLI